MEETTRKYSLSTCRIAGSGFQPGTMGLWIWMCVAWLGVDQRSGRRVFEEGKELRWSNNMG
jgi:hypothetical protein